MSNAKRRPDFYPRARRFTSRDSLFTLAGMSPALRDNILTHMLPLVPFSGWSEHSLREAGKRAGLNAAATARTFPKGAQQCLEYFLTLGDEALARDVSSASLATLRMPERIKTLILARLAYCAPHREALRRALALRIMPWNAARSASSLYSLIDTMWRLAGDHSTDFSFYTKRITLASLYSTTLLYWLNDESESFADTAAYLDRRLQNIADFGRWKKSPGNPFNRFAHS